MAVRDATDIALSEVCNEIYGAFNAGMNQNQCFIDATGIFDTRYSGAKDRLSNFQNYQHIMPNGGYGRLYNLYSLLDSRNIAPSGWHVPTSSELITLKNAAGDYATGAYSVIETGTTHWEAPNINATNSLLLSLVGGGFRYGNISKYPGMFAGIKKFGNLAATDWYNLEYSNTPHDSQTIGMTPYYTYSNTYGMSVRFIKDDSNNTGIMTDNSGYTYKTVKIGNQVWMASNLRGTKYRNGDTIPTVTDNATWAALTTGACCSYNNNDVWAAADNYVLPGTTVRIEINNGFDGINNYLYAQAININTESPITVNTNVTVYFTYKYYDYTSNTIISKNAYPTIMSGNNKTTNIVIGGALVSNPTVTSVSPTNYNGYTYII